MKRINDTGCFKKFNDKYKERDLTKKSNEVIPGIYWKDKNIIAYCSDLGQSEYWYDRYKVINLTTIISYQIKESFTESNAKEEKLFHIILSGRNKDKDTKVALSFYGNGIDAVDVYHFFGEHINRIICERCVVNLALVDVNTLSYIQYETVVLTICREDYGKKYKSFCTDTIASSFRSKLSIRDAVTEVYYDTIAYER